MTMQVRVCGRGVAILSTGKRMAVWELLWCCVLAGLYTQAAEMVALQNSQRKGRKMGADKYSCYETGMDEWFMEVLAFILFYFRRKEMVGDVWC